MNNSDRSISVECQPDQSLVTQKLVPYPSACDEGRTLNERAADFAQASASERVNGILHPEKEKTSLQEFMEMQHGCDVPGLEGAQSRLGSLLRESGSNPDISSIDIDPCLDIDYWIEEL